METTQQRNLILPKPHLSWSQLTCWITNPTRYRREYFENGKKLDTKYLTFGKNIATLIENGQHKELLPELECYDTPEHEIKCLVDGVPILSKLDSYDSEKHIFREYKTGTQKWDKARVQKHDQLLFYAVALKWSDARGAPVFCDLDWIETKESGGESVDFWRENNKILHITGRIVSFHREFDEREIERMEQLIVKVAYEISDAYQEYLKEI
jgi:hypothetical protein